MITHPLSWYDRNTVVKDVKLQIIHPSILLRNDELLLTRYIAIMQVCLKPTYEKHFLARL